VKYFKHLFVIIFDDYGSQLMKTLNSKLEYRAKGFHGCEP